MKHGFMPFVRQPENKKTGTRLVSQLLVPVFLSVLLYGSVPIAICLVGVGSH